jgi:hypothetical protein
VNKEVLSQVECLCVLQVNGAHERKALEEWVQEAGADRKLVGELPGLARGEGYVWSPSWLRVFQRVRFATKTTFDASATPEVGRAARAASLSSVDVAALKADLAEVVAAAEKDDPKVLRRRLAELERELAKKPAPAPMKEKRVEVPVLKDGQVKRLEAVVEKGWKLQARLHEEAERIAGVINTNANTIQFAIDALGTAIGAAKRGSAALPAPARAPVTSSQRARALLPSIPTIRQEGSIPRADARRRRGEANGATPDGVLGKGELRVLAAVAQHQEGVTREQLTVLTGYKRSSRDTYLQRLRARGLVLDGERITVTDAGVAELGDGFEPLPTGAALLEHWRQQLPAGERAVLEVVVAEYPEPVDREYITARTQYQRSSRDTYLQRLRARHLITEPGRGLVRASDALFDGGR